MRRSCFCTAVIAALVSMQAATAETLHALQPVIDSIFPRGGAQGSEISVSVRGHYLNNASDLRFSGQGVTARILESTESEIQARVTIARDAAPSRRDLRIFTPQGTFVQVFEVSSLREQIEKEPNDSPEAAEPIELPVLMNGRINAGDYDHFQFHASKGQTVVCDLKSARVGTRFDGVMWILDAQGREVAFADDSYFDKDPRIVFTAPEDGAYVLRISGFREAGSAAAEYRLLVGAVAHASYVFPAGARRGESVDLQIAGFNLDQVTAIGLDGIQATAQILSREKNRLRVRLAIAPESTPGVYELRLWSGAAELPGATPFVVSDLREMVVDGPTPAAPLDLSSPLVINRVIAKPHQKDNFLVDVAAGEQLMIQGDAMVLGNFLDPLVTIFNQAGEPVAYMDEAAPNGFDKEPTTVDFHLVHRFEKAGRYRVEFRDASLRGDETFVYRLLVGKAQPRFEVYVQTNQVSVVAGKTAILPVRVRRFGGWNAPVEVWVEGLPARVESRRTIAEPVNTRFRGTFSEDYFFDGTNVELPLQAHSAAKPGCTPVHVRAQGTFEGRPMEQAAPVHYPWQQTGFLRGPGGDQQMMLTVAPPPQFDLEGPATVSLSAGGLTGVKLSIHWMAAPAKKSGLHFEAGRLPEGVRIDHVDIAEDALTAQVFLSAATAIAGQRARLSVVGSIRTEAGVYKAAHDIEIQWSKAKSHVSGENTP